MSLYFSRGEIPLLKESTPEGGVWFWNSFLGFFLRGQISTFTKKPTSMTPYKKDAHFVSKKNNTSHFLSPFFLPVSQTCWEVLMANGDFRYETTRMTFLFGLVTLLTWELPFGRWLIIGKLWLQNYSRGAVTIETKNWFKSQRVEITIREILAFHFPWLGNLIIHHHGSISNS